MTGPESLEPFLKAVWSKSWQLFQGQALTFILASLVMLVLMVVSLGILAGPLFVGYIELVRKAGRGETIAVGDLFRGFDFFLPSFLASVLIGIMFLIGMVLLFLPCLAVALFTAFTLHAIAFENLSATAAISRSFKLVMDNLVNVLVLFFLAAVAQTLGGSVILGTLITTPFVLIAYTVAYERMSSPAGIIDTTGQAIPV
jgi:hypothetical protein